MYVWMKRAVIMGTSSGIGRGIATRLLDDGWCVGVAARRLGELEKIRETYPNMVKTKWIDVTNDDADDLLRSLIEDLGGVDLYVHASGVGYENAALDREMELKTVGTNVLGFTNMVAAAFNHMATNGGGHIAVVSSIAGTKGLSPAPSYGASKAYQNNYIQALEQLANSRHLNIRFTDIRPGFVDTPLLAGKAYPILMKTDKVARLSVSAIYRNRHVAVIDWRYAILTWLWRLIPNAAWRRVKLLERG